MILLQLPIAALAEIDLPVEGGVVTSGVGWRIDPFGTGKLVFHRGMNIAVPAGTQVMATRKGRVILPVITKVMVSLSLLSMPTEIVLFMDITLRSGFIRVMLWKQAV
jgi:hypothetical protein